MDRESATLLACRRHHYCSHCTASSAELHRTRKPLPLPEEIGHPDPGVLIILLQREIDWLFAAHIVDQPKPTLAAIPDFVVVHLPIKNERASPSKPGSHHPAG